jgi:hypothetical protein
MIMLFILNSMAFIPIQLYVLLSMGSILFSWLLTSAFAADIKLGILADLSKVGNYRYESDLDITALLTMTSFL